MVVALIHQVLCEYRNPNYSLPISFWARRRVCPSLIVSNRLVRPRLRDKSSARWHQHTPHSNRVPPPVNPPPAPPSNTPFLSHHQHPLARVPPALKCVPDKIITTIQCSPETLALALSNAALKPLAWHSDEQAGGLQLLGQHELHLGDVGQVHHQQHVLGAGSRYQSGGAEKGTSGQAREEDAASVHGFTSKRV